MNLNTEIFITLLPRIVFHNIYRVAILTNQSFQSCNKSLINQACSGPYWAIIGPRSFLYGPRCARSVLSRPRANIRPVRPSRLVNKISYCEEKFDVGSKRVKPAIRLTVEAFP